MPTEHVGFSAFHAVAYLVVGLGQLPQSIAARKVEEVVNPEKTIN